MCKLHWIEEKRKCGKNFTYFSALYNDFPTFYTLILRLTLVQQGRQLVIYNVKKKICPIYNKTWWTWWEFYNIRPRQSSSTFSVPSRWTRRAVLPAARKFGQITQNSPNFKPWGREKFGPNFWPNFLFSQILAENSPNYQSSVLIYP